MQKRKNLTLGTYILIQNAENCTMFDLNQNKIP